MRRLRREPVAVTLRPSGESRQCVVRRREERELVGVGLALPTRLHLAAQAIETDTQQVGVAGTKVALVGKQLVVRTGGGELAWAMRWESVARSPAARPLLLRERPVLAKNLELCVIHRVEGGALAPANFTLQTDYPFSMESRVHPWTVALAGVCDGKRTGLELHDLCRKNGWIPPDLPAEDFAGFLCSLVSGGFLEVEGFVPPAP